MKVFQDAFGLSDLPRGVVATIGNYDGIHRGQQAILERIVERARELSTSAVVVTFEPHPLTVLRPDEAPPQLTTWEQKEALLAATGVDAVAVIRFDLEFSRTPAERFVREFLAGSLAAREVYVGAGFVFGHRRDGNPELLRRLGEELGFTAAGVPEVIYRGERISSTRIRRAVAEGRVEEAERMLGRAYSLTGVIVRGDRMGQRLGWPTANLQPHNELVPAGGVYAGRMALPSFPATFDCATNVGTRPTVYENYQLVVESHIFDFSTDIYGEQVELGFYKRLREEQLFPTVMDLSAQIKRDVEATREYFAARRRSQEGTATSAS